MRDGAELWWEGKQKEGENDEVSLKNRLTLAGKGSLTSTYPHLPLHRGWSQQGSGLRVQR
jgi:hypothetical protein